MAPFFPLLENLDVILLTFSISQTTVITLVKKIGEPESLFIDSSFY